MPGTVKPIICMNNYIFKLNWLFLCQKLTQHRLSTSAYFLHDSKQQVNLNKLIKICFNLVQSQTKYVMQSYI